MMSEASNLPDPKAPPGRCRFCRCVDARACDVGCTWVDDRLTVCSTCELFVNLSAADARAIVTAAGFDFDEEGIIAFSELVERLHAGGYQIVRRLDLETPTAANLTRLPSANGARTSRAARKKSARAGAPRRRS